MPTTTNNGWPTPADTDLVKNGADAIRDLGNAIDTTLGVYSPVTPGLVKINTTSFSAVSSISVPANTFTTTYDNYFAVFQASFATAANITLRLRASGSDLSSALYRYAQHYIATNADHTLDTGNTQTSGRVLSTNINRPVSQITFYNPFLTAKTQFDVQTGGGRDATVFAAAQYGTNEYDATTSVDAFTLIFSQSGTGTVSVYGFNK